jgi:hypothetical protein
MINLFSLLKRSAVVIKKVESLSQEKLKEMLCLNVYWSVEKVSSMCKHLFETFEYVTFYKL